MKTKCPGFLIEFETRVSLKIGCCIGLKHVHTCFDHQVFISCMTKKYCTSEMCNKEATASERKKHIIPMLFEDLDRWPPQGPLGMVFSDTLYLRLPDGILNNEKFEELSKKIMELV